MLFASSSEVGKEMDGRGYKELFALFEGKANMWKGVHE